MPCIEYAPKRFGASSELIIQHANKIIEEYRAQGFTLTLRQLYYQFVARDIIPNTPQSYKRLGSIINEARLAGRIDWEAIEDRTRNLVSQSHWTSPADILASAASSYAIDKWEGQEYRPEVWIEKDALVGVIEGVCQEFDISYFSCRGYTSQSEMWSAAMRYKSTLRKDQKPLIIHLGDHDPSGIDMTRDIEDRISMFLGVTRYPVVRIALNMDQVEQYKPPPNPAKTTDSRYSGYIHTYGTESWELDALEPLVLYNLIRETVLEYRDEVLWEEKEDQEEMEKARLQLIVNKERKKDRK